MYHFIFDLIIITVNSILSKVDFNRNHTRFMYENNMYDEFKLKQAFLFENNFHIFIVSVGNIILIYLLLLDRVWIS